MMDSDNYLAYSANPQLKHTVPSSLKYCTLLPLLCREDSTGTMVMGKVQSFADRV